MSEQEQQLSMWSGEPIVHVALALKASKLDPTDQPVWNLSDVEPGQRVRFVVEGYIDDQVKEDRTEAGWVRFVSATIERAYEIDSATATALLDQGKAATGEALRKRMGLEVNEDAVA